MNSSSHVNVWQYIKSLSEVTVFIKEELPEVFSSFFLLPSFSLRFQKHYPTKPGLISSQKTDKLYGVGQAFEN